VMTSEPEFLHLQPLIGLLLLAPLGNTCPMGVMSKPIGATGLATSGITNMPFWMTGALEPGRPEPPSMQTWLGSVNITGWPEPPDSLLGMVLLVLSGNVRLMGIPSTPFTTGFWHD